jgi:hypothetical protein
VDVRTEPLESDSPEPEHDGDAMVATITPTSEPETDSKAAESAVEPAEEDAGSADLSDDPDDDPDDDPAGPAQPARPSFGERLHNALSVRFRLPNADDPSPEPEKLLAMATWAATLGLIGLIPGGRLLLELLTGGSPVWYPAVTLAVGLLGLAAIAAAFASVHRRKLPWYGLIFATGLLIVNIVLVYAVLNSLT